MWYRRGVLVMCVGLMVSCGNPTNQTPAATATFAATATVAHTATALPAPTATAVVVPSPTPGQVDAPDATAIAAIIQASLPATPTADASGEVLTSVGEPVIVPVWNDASGQYVAAITTGMMDDVETPHPLTIYQKQDGKFVAVTHYDYTNAEYISSIEVIPNVDPQKAFFVVHGGVGAHSSFGTVFSFDGKRLNFEIEGHSDAGGGAVAIADVNGDGVLDVVTDATDYYVFCYACGVRIWNHVVYAWDGAAFVEQTIQPASDAATNNIVAFAQAQRWNKVDALLAQLTPPTREADQWNVALMRHMATLRRPTADEPFPLLSHIFYGDYDAAVAMLKLVGAQETADFKGSWFAGPIAEGQDVENTLDFRHYAADNMVNFAEIALAQDPTDTSAQFIRGWARTLNNPQDIAGVRDLQAVANADPFFAAVRDAVVGR